jgi:hypothetical protein
MYINLNAVEARVIEDLADAAGMSPHGVFKQALRLYQHHINRLEEGETCPYSGDAARTR